MTRPDASESVLDADGPSTNWMKSVDSARPADGQGGNGTALPSRGRPVRTRDGHVDGPSPGRAGHVDGPSPGRAGRPVDGHCVRGLSTCPGRPSRHLDGLAGWWTASASAGCRRPVDGQHVRWLSTARQRTGRHLDGQCVRAWSRRANGQDVAGWPDQFSGPSSGRTGAGLHSI